MTYRKFYFTLKCLRWSSEAINPKYVQKTIERINSSPYLINNLVKIVDFGVNFSIVETQIQNLHLQAYHIVHGGLYATLIDTAAYWSAYASLNDKWGGLISVDLKMNFLSNIESGKVIAKGRLIKMGKTLGYAEATVETENGKILAHGTSTLLTVQQAKPENIDLPQKFLKVGS